MTAKRIVAILVVLALVGGGAWYWKAQKARKLAAEEIEIETATVERKDLIVTVAASGVLEALTTVEVKSRSGGEIAKMYAEAGDYVEAGQLIAQIDPTALTSRAGQAEASLQSSRASATQAQLNASLQEVQSATSLAQARAGLDSARASLRQVEEQLTQERQTVSDDVKRAEASVRSARARLAQAEAQSEAQKALSAADLESASASAESARQNLARVKSGPRSEQIAQARAGLRSADAAVENAATSLRRQEALLKQGFVAQQAVDDARRTHEQSLAQRESAAQGLAELEAGSRPEDIAQAEAQMRQAKASLQQAETNQMQIKLREHDVTTARSGVQEAEAALASAQARTANIKVREQQLEASHAAVRQAEASLKRAEAGNLETEVRRKQVESAMADVRRNMLALQDASYDLQYTRVVAPRSGVIMQKLVEEGTVIPAGTAALREGTSLVTIADISEMYVLAEVDEVDIAPVEEGQPCRVNVSSLPDERLRGEVVKIFPLGITTENVVRFQVKVHVQDPPKTLRPGMTADVTITVAEKKDILVLADAAITRDQSKKRKTVQLVTGKEETEEREVEIGLSNWEETEIIEGLDEGDEVIIPPPPGTPLPRWMGGGDRQNNAQRARQGMMRQMRR